MSATGDANKITIKREVNFNTIAIFVGFGITLSTIVGSWANLQAQQQNFGAFVAEQKAFNAATDQRFKQTDEKLAAVPLITSQIAGLQASDLNFDTRLGRINDSSADIRAQLGSLVTQVALVKQSVDRIEAWRAADRAAQGQGISPN